MKVNPIIVVCDNKDQFYRFAEARGLILKIKDNKGVNQCEQYYAVYTNKDIRMQLMGFVTSGIIFCSRDLSEEDSLYIMSRIRVDWEV